MSVALASGGALTPMPPEVLYIQRTVSLVIPAKNEAANLPWVMGRIPAFVDEVILVDGNSTDGSVPLARALRPDVRVLADERPGKGAALRAGLLAATGDYVVMIDADGSMDPAEIDRFVSRLSAGCDMVKGSRFVGGGGTTDMGVVRRLGNAGLRGLANACFRSHFTDLCYGYCAFRRDAIPALALTADGFEIETQIVIHAILAGLRIEEVPSFEAPRISGDSNLDTWRDGRRVLETLLRVRFDRRRTALGANAVVIPATAAAEGVFPAAAPAADVVVPAPVTSQLVAN
jgi:glycosyltransferase involved in cell wall biosynthesis